MPADFKIGVMIESFRCGLRGGLQAAANLGVQACSSMPPVARRILKKAGYDGVLSVEFEGMEDVLTGIRIGHDNLRRIVSTV